MAKIKISKILSWLRLKDDHVFLQIFGSTFSYLICPCGVSFPLSWRHLPKDLWLWRLSSTIWLGPSILGDRQHLLLVKESSKKKLWMRKVSRAVPFNCILDYFIGFYRMVKTLGHMTNLRQTPRPRCHHPRRKESPRQNHLRSSPAIKWWM